MTTQPTLELIPRELLFGNPDKASARISADGQWLSYLAPVDGVLNVWVTQVDNLDAAKPVTKDTGRGVRFYTWAYTNQHLLYIQDKDGDENWRLYCVDLQNGGTKDLTPFDDVQAQINGVSPDFPNEVLVGLNNRNPQLHDLYRVNIDTGEMNLVLENEGFLKFVTDANYAVRYAALMRPDGGMDVMRRSGAESDNPEWVPFAQIDMEDTLTTTPIGMSRDGKTLYMTDSRGRNTAAIMAINAETGEEILLAEIPERMSVTPYAILLPMLFRPSPSPTCARNGQSLTTQLPMIWHSSKR